MASLEKISGLPDNLRATFEEPAYVEQFMNVISETRVRPLEEVLLRGEAQQGLLITLERDFYFSGLGTALQALDKGKLVYATFRTKMDEYGIDIQGQYNPAHLVSVSARAKLTGRTRVFTAAYIDALDTNLIELRPVVIADRMLSWKSATLGTKLDYPGWVSPCNIDNFKKMSDINPRLDLNEMKTYSEEQVKEWFAQIVGEPVVPKDWGGEYCDLYASTLTIDGQRLMAAFAFKGPAKFHQMKLTDLGKNADQVVRLFDLQADIVVLQHCHTVGPEVRKTVHAFASRIDAPSYYCIIDGYDTLRILKAYGKV